MYTVSEFRTVQQLPCHNKRVLLRADLNVPLADGTIVDDFRLQAILPTIQYLQQQNGIVILATHIGRPKKQEPELSTKLLVPWFEKHGYSVIFEPDLTNAKNHTDPHTVVLLENMRFYSGEKEQDMAFAKQLAACAELYVNDAFALSHRTDSSVTLVPQLFAADKRAIGFLIEKELTQLNRLIITPQQPFVLIIGGGKVHDKLPLLTAMLDRVQTMLLCPAIVFTFLKAVQKPVGISLVDQEALESTRTLMQHAHQKNVTLIFPVDYQVALKSLDGPLEYVQADQMPSNALGMSLGPESIKLFSKYIANAGTIFFNAGMGFDHRPETLEGGKQLLQAVATSTAYSVVGGGSSVALARNAGLQENISFLSSGGGATLTYLANQPLPGLDALVQRTKT